MLSLRVRNRLAARARARVLAELGRRHKDEFDQLYRLELEVVHSEHAMEAHDGQHK